MHLSAGECDVYVMCLSRVCVSVVHICCVYVMSECVVCDRAWGCIMCDVLLCEVYVSMLCVYVSV